MEPADETGVLTPTPSTSQIRKTRTSSRLAGPAKPRPSYVESESESDEEVVQQPVRKKRKLLRRGRPRLSEQPAEQVPDAPPELALATTTARPALSERDKYMLMLLDTSNSRSSYCPYAHIRRPTTSSSLSLLLNNDFDDAEARAPREFVSVYMAQAEHARSNLSSNRPWSHYPTHVSPHYPTAATSFAHVPPVASRLRPATWQQQHSSFRSPDPRPHHHTPTHRSINSAYLLSPPQMRRKHPHAQTQTHTRNRSLSGSSGSSTAESALPATPSPRVGEPALQASPLARKSVSWMDTVLSPASTSNASPGPLFKSAIVPPRAPAPSPAAACWQCTTLGTGACSRHTSASASASVSSTVS